jgi:hypothetical protein
VCQALEFVSFVNLGWHTFFLPTRDEILHTSPSTQVQALGCVPKKTFAGPRLHLRACLAVWDGLGP